MFPRPPHIASCAFGSRTGRACFLALAVAAAAACSAERLVGSGALPPEFQDPAITQTPAGALAAYRGTLVMFGGALGQGDPLGGKSYIEVSGVLSDELQTNTVGQVLLVIDAKTALDGRTLPEAPIAALEGGTYNAVYGSLHLVRGQAEEAQGLLGAYGGDSSRALLGHLYAVEGYSEVLLADLFCSGVPLSTIDYAGDYTYQPGATTSQVYQHAITLFDSALTLAADSARVVSLAHVGTGRALLALGQYAAAAAAVADVPDGFQYIVQTYDAGPRANFAGTNNWTFTVADREGGNGLDYRSSGDPRTASSAVGTNLSGVTLYRPDKYATDGSSPIVLADWIEARLIEAEAALQGGDVTTWLVKLNHLRETAITPALPDTTDPGTPDARVDLTFRERAFWLFLTGHRQGDLRRLIRQYGRQPDQVYPTGPYPGGSGIYGGAVNAPVPATEREFNPKFTGCIGRGA